jgi:hypothetical protein
MGGTFYSNCSTINTGCYIYSDNTLYTKASNGYYSDGTNYYIVTGGIGEVTSVGTCFYAGDVYITAGGETSLDSSGDYNYSLFADSISSSYGSNPVCVEASPLIGYVAIYTGFNTYYATGSIGYNAKCSTNFYAAGGTPFDPVSFISLYSISPLSAGGQNYYISTSDIGAYACSTPLC